MDRDYLIGPKVKLGARARIDANVRIGLDKQELKTVIGKGAVIRSGTVVYGGNRIGNNFQTGHGVLVREENKIGNNVSVGSHSVIEHHVKIGNGARIHSNAFVPEYSLLGDNSWIGPGAVLTNARYPRSVNVKQTLKGPKIRSGAKVGANATILPGVIIGKDALVGAGAVVIENVPSRKVVVGNPAKVINSIDNLPYE